MNHRPLAVTGIAWLFIVVGILDIAAQGTRIDLRHPFAHDVGWVVALGLVAIVAGVFLLRGQNWARWLAIAWMAFHVGISLFDAASKAVVHSIVLVLIAYGLLSQPSAKYFRKSA